jgi:anti-anti-sigma factor
MLRRGSMSMERRVDQAATIVTLFGNLEGSRSIQFNDYIDRVFEESPKKVVVDLSQVDFMASTGLALLISAHKRAERHGIPLVFAGPPRVVSETVSLTKLDSLLLIYEDIQDAITGSVMAPSPTP